MLTASRIVPRQLHTFDAFHNPGYRLLWPAYLFANISRWMQLTMLAWLVLELTDSPLRVALVGFSGMSPMLFLGMVGGVLADRVDRRRLILASQVASLLAAVAMAAVLLLGVEHYWHAYLVMMVSGIGWALDMPSRRALLPDLMGRSGVTNAVALDSVAMHCSLLLGPMLAGTLISLVDVSGGYLVVTSFYLAAVLLIRAVKLPGPPKRYGQPANIVGNLIEGFRYVRGNNVLLATVWVTVFMNLLMFPYVQMVPVIAKETLEVGPGLMGVLMGASGFGALLGAVLIASRGGITHHGRFYLGGSLLALVALMAFSLSTWYTVSLPILVILGLGTAGFGTMQATITMLVSSEEMRGRALGVISLAIGVGPLGAVITGAVASAYGAPFAIGLNAAIGLALLVTVGVLMPSLLRPTVLAAQPQAEAAQPAPATPRG